MENESLDLAERQSDHSDGLELWEKYTARAAYDLDCADPNLGGWIKEDRYELPKMSPPHS
jgi:hypothetical protein